MMRYRVALAMLLGSRALASPATQPFESGIRDAKSGDILLLPDSLDLKQIPILEIKTTDAHGPQFLFSDKPEYFRTGNGIAMQEEVKAGLVRLYIYHCPEPSG